MPTVRCPDCDAAVELPEAVTSGDLVECPNCAGSALRMRAEDGGWVASLADRRIASGINRCACCGEAITRPQQEYEPQGHPGLHAHARCYMVWVAESVGLSVDDSNVEGGRHRETASGS